jgi:hypothetical protein
MRDEGSVLCWEPSSKVTSRQVSKVQASVEGRAHPQGSVSCQKFHAQDAHRLARASLGRAACTATPARPARPARPAKATRATRSLCCCACTKYLYRLRACTSTGGGCNLTLILGHGELFPAFRLALVVIDAGIVSAQPARLHAQAGTCSVAGRGREPGYPARISAGLH